jgi:hypothetical protein
MQVRAAAVRVILGLGLAGGIAACELNDVTAPDFEARAVVHAMLDPGASSQLVLVERTAVTAAETSVPGDPHVNPISGARVIIYGPSGDSVIALEDRQTRGGEAGAYRFATRSTLLPPSQQNPAALRLVAGGRYRLRVETPLGTVTGETRMPVFNGPADVRGGRFNLDADTLRLAAVPNDPATAGYRVELGPPFGFVRGRYVRDLVQPLVFPADIGNDAWAFAFARGDILPGATESFTVVALDSNAYKYEVAGFDPFGDDTRGNTLRGGVGVFGAMVVLADRTLDLTADRDNPIEGDWQANRLSQRLPVTLRLYESPRFPGFRFGTDLELSGLGQWSTVSRPTSVVAQVAGGFVRVDVAGSATAPVGPINGRFSGGVLTLIDPVSSQETTYRRP